MLSEHAQKVLAKLDGKLTTLDDDPIIVERPTARGGTVALHATGFGSHEHAMSPEHFEAICAASRAVGAGEETAPRKVSGFFMGGYASFAGIQIYMDPSMPPGEVQVRDHEGRVAARFTFPAAPEEPR